LLCIVGAALAVVVMRPLLRCPELEVWLVPPAVGYPSLVILLALLSWLVFFRGTKPTAASITPTLVTAPEQAG